jgi:starch phosphorylase
LSDWTASATTPARRRRLPAGLSGLWDLAYNLWWAWHPEASRLFAQLDPECWERSRHNPVAVLREVEEERLRAAAEDPAFQAACTEVLAAFQAAVRPPAVSAGDGARAPGVVAYASAEFALAPCLPTYAGGLGVLAGDVLKSASDLGLPVVGVTLLYREGYFRQVLDEAGRQRESYDPVDPEALPLEPARGADGGAIVTVPFPGREVALQIWQARVGRATLLLLDAALPQNTPEDRRIAARLYDGDRETRLQQELLLGVGGHRALAALGIRAEVFHLNEGHSALLVLERLRAWREEGLAFEEACRRAAASVVFTTHTPVPAGHDVFPPDLARRYLEPLAAAAGVEPDALVALGRVDPADPHEPFSMTALAMRCSARRTAVSPLHEAVTRRMWRRLWPEVEEAAVSIGHVTNGVHLAAWVGPAMARLFDAHLGAAWRHRPHDPEVWRPLAAVPDEALWEARAVQRRTLVELVNGRLARGAGAVGLSPLDPEAFTVGFARRFATYKRATLLLRDPERLARLLGDPARPVQILFAGKAHPRHEEGKALIQAVVAHARDERFGGRLVFLEEYDLALAAALVQGADLWLNTPRRPEEASGTSGMKAVANGALHLSTLDGWWEEAVRLFPGEAFGWALPVTDVLGLEEQDARDADALLGLLEGEVVPLFYDRDGALPRRWLARVKTAIRRLCPRYNTHRVLEEYVAELYAPVVAGRA